MADYSSSTIPPAPPLPPPQSSTFTAFDEDQEYITTKLTDLFKTTSYISPSVVTTAPSIVKRLSTSSSNGVPTQPSKGETTMKNMDLDGEITTLGISKPPSIETSLTLFSQAIIQLFVTFAVLLKQSPIPDAIVTLTGLTASAWVSLNKKYGLQKKLLLMMEVIMKIQIFLVSVFLTAVLRGLIAFQKTRGYHEWMEERASTQSGSYSSASNNNLYGAGIPNVNLNTSLSTSLPACAAPINTPLTIQFKRPSNPEDIVNLSVGGVKVSTSWRTLTSENCVFSKLDSHSAKGIWWKDGLYFVDRDGSHFRHILNYLRGIDTIRQIDDQQILNELLLESDFYQLYRLKRQLEYMLGLEPNNISSPCHTNPPSPPRSRSPTNRSRNPLRTGYEKMKSIVPNPLQSYM